MSLYQASFRVRHECPYRELSDAVPDLTIREWYLSECQVLEITTDEAPTEDLLDRIESLGTVLHESVDGDGLQVITQSCLCSLEDSIIERFESHRCLYQPPTVHRNGWEHYTVIAFSEADVNGLLAELDADRDIDLLSKTDVSTAELPHSMLAPVDQLFQDLTDRQIAALRLALERGYYEEPRQTSLRELAGSTSVARSTFEEHLRKAENKLFTNVGRFLQMVSASSGTDPLRSESGSRAEGQAD